jgi:thiamine-phosphate pyrophosphorylase
MFAMNTPRFYLITPPLTDTAAFDVDPALAAGDVAAVLIRLGAGDERKLIERAKPVIAAVQRRDVAALLDTRADLVARLGADGAHLTGTDAFAAALPLLKPDRIAGAGGLFSRHDAMLAGETGADYVMFGEPSPVGGNRPDFAEIEERLEWWAGIVEIPCVGYAASLGEVEALARTGADFLALGDWIWTDPKGASAIVAAAADILKVQAPR